MVSVFLLTTRMRYNKIENVKKFIIVKLYGEKLRVVKAPSKNGDKNITKNLLFNKAIKLNLKSSFLFYSFYNSLYF